MLLLQSPFRSIFCLIVISAILFWPSYQNSNFYGDIYSFGLIGMGIELCFSETWNRWPLFFRVDPLSLIANALAAYAIALLWVWWTHKRAGTPK